MATLNIDVRLNDNTADGFKKLREELRRLQAEANRVATGAPQNQQQANQQNTANNQRERTERERLRQRGRILEAQANTEAKGIRANSQIRQAELAKENAILENRGKQIDRLATKEQQIRDKRIADVKEEGRTTRAQINQDTRLFEQQSKERIKNIDDRTRRQLSADRIEQQRLRNSAMEIAAVNKREEQAHKSKLGRLDLEHKAEIESRREIQRTDEAIRRERGVQAERDASRQQREARAEES